MFSMSSPLVFNRNQKLMRKIPTQTFTAYNFGSFISRLTVIVISELVMVCFVLSQCWSCRLAKYAGTSMAKRISSLEINDAKT